MYIRSSSVYKTEPQQHPFFRYGAKVPIYINPRVNQTANFLQKHQICHQISDIRYAISRSWIFSFRHESDWLLWIKYWFAREV